MKYTKNILLLLFAFSSQFSKGQSNKEILDLLKEKGIVTQSEIDSIQKEKNTENTANSQKEKDNKDKTLTVDLQIKNRAEYRNGYRNLPNGDSQPTGFVNQRTRITAKYEHAGLMDAVVSIQDARVWGSHDPAGLGGTIQLILNKINYKSSYFYY
ncbi:MAG: hypothetical protein C4K58_00015 [Flavobacteriaceae bacterium]|nr:MAG: hypothetical protein C4K58_00015 [Flavobacteriaceae bacterium]